LILNGTFYGQLTSFLTEISMAVVNNEQKKAKMKVTLPFLGIYFYEKLSENNLIEFIFYKTHQQLISLNFDLI
jgi:hypothetical protein